MQINGQVMKRPPRLSLNHDLLTCKFTFKGSVLVNFAKVYTNLYILLYTKQSETVFETLQN